MSKPLAMFMICCLVLFGAGMTMCAAEDVAEDNAVVVEASDESTIEADEEYTADDEELAADDASDEEEEVADDSEASDEEEVAEDDAAEEPIEEEAE
jgi:hypothetical protein